MVVLVAQIAAIYAAVCIPFKLAVVVPGVTEVRPATAIPVVCGILFGPAAAWGSAFGNLIADFFGTLGPGSLAGFVANFLYAYVPYRLWRLLAPGRAEFRAAGPGARLLGAVMFACTIAALLVCGVVNATDANGDHPLLRYAYWATTGILILSNLFVLLMGMRLQQPENLGEVMDGNSGVNPALFRNAFVGVAVSAFPIFVFWDSSRSVELTFALCELVVLIDAVLLAIPVWTAVKKRPETRLATSTLGKFGLTALVSSAVCAFGVGFGVDALGVVPFQIVSPLILVNNFVLTCLLGPLLLGILYPRVARWGLLVDDVLPPATRAEGYAPFLGALLVAVAAVGGLVVGCWLGFAPEQAVMKLYLLGLDLAPQVPVWKATLPFAVAILAGTALL
jgi:hypothetical protein